MLRQELLSRNLPPLLSRAEMIEILQREEYGYLPKNDFKWSVSNFKRVDGRLAKGKVIYYTSDKAGNKQYMKTKMNGVDIPLVVIANENSASASEILVGAVKDHGRGKIVGTKTFGKGVVQSVIKLHDDSALKITIERYYTPNGNYIHGRGIEPDYYVELGETTDTQLEKAIELLKNQ